MVDWLINCKVGQLLADNGYILEKENSQEAPFSFFFFLLDFHRFNILFNINLKDIRNYDLLHQLDCKCKYLIYFYKIKYIILRQIFYHKKNI